MGNPNPFANKGPENPFTKPDDMVAVKEKQRQKESVEKAKKRKEPTFRDFEKKAEKVKSDPNERAAQVIRQLDGAKETVKQLEGLTALNAALVSVLTKLAKKDVDIEKIKTPKQLQKAVTKSGIKLTLPEAAAVENLNEIAGKSGPTAKEIKDSWPDRVKTAKDASEGLGTKYAKYFKKDPVGTAALTLVGAAGIYLTYQGIKTIVKKAFDKDEGGKKDSWFKREIAIPIAIIAAGTFLGKDTVKEILKDSGLDYFGVKDKVTKGKDFTKKEKERLEKASNKIKEKLDERRAKKPEHEPSAGGSVEPEPRPGALQPDKPEKAEVKPAEIETFGDKLLTDAGAEKLADKSYVFMTGSTKTYYRFHEGKWEWASVRQKKADEWVATGGNYYGDKEKYKKANDLAEKLGKGPEGIAAEKKESNEALAENAEKWAKAESPLMLMIEIFYYNDFEFNDSDRSQIGSVVEEMRQKKTKVGEVLTLWAEYKDKKKIPNQNGLGTFKPGIEEVNIHRAVKMIAETAQEYQKRSKLDYSQLTVEDFLEKHLANDPTQKMHNAVQQSIIESVKDAGITDILSFNNIKIDKVREQLAELAKDGWKDVAKDLGVDIEKLDENEKKHLGLIVTYLMQGHARLDMKWEEIIGQTHFPKKGVNDKTLGTAKEFFEKIRENTLKKGGIIDAAVERFNFGPDIAKGSGNADIIKNNLNEKITFKNALYLNLVTKDIDLGKPAVSGAQEAAFLFTVLNCLNEDQRTRYTSILINVVTEYPDKFPSIKLIAPYLELAANFGIDYVKRKMHHLSNLASEMMINRSFEDQQAWLKRMKDAPMMQWAIGTGKEAGFGALAIGWEIIDPMIRSGKITYEELGHCEGPWDFIMLIKKAGGTLVYSEDENGHPHGWVHLAGSVFVFRPIGTVKETLSSLVNGEGPVDKIGGALKVWTAGSAPFITIGAVRGYYLQKWTELGHLPFNRWVKGAAWGGVKAWAGYPYWALKKSYQAARYTTSAIMNMPKAIPEYASRPTQAARRVGRGAADFVKYRSVFPGKNVPNMLESGKRFMHYLESSNFTQMDLKEKLASLGDSKGRRLLLRRLQNGFDNSMAIRYATRYAHDYNKFFNFDAASSGRLYLADILEESVGDYSKVEKKLGGEIGRVKESFERLEKVFRSLESHKGAFSEMGDLAGSSLARGEMQKKIATLMQESMGFTQPEAEALAKGIRSRSDVVKLQKRMKEGFDMFESFSDASTPAKRSAVAAKLAEKVGGIKEAVGKKVGDIKKGIKESRRAPTHLESTRSFGKTSEALKTTEKQLKETRKMAKAAEEEIGLLNRMRSGGGQKVAEKLGLTPAGKYSSEYSPSALAKRYEQARKIAQDARAAEKKLETSVDALRQVKQAEDAIAAAGDTTAASGKGSKLLKDLLRAEEAAEEALEVSGKAAGNIGKFGKVGTALKWGGRGLGIAGALFSAYELQASFREAWSTDIAERKTLKYAESGLWAANLVADGAAVAVMYGAGGTAATYASAAALPLIPITYAATTMGEVVYEGTKTDYEWVQANPYETLHHFYTSVNSISLGDAWIGGFKAMGRSPVQLGMTLLGGPAVAAGAPVTWETQGQKEAWDQSYAESVKTKVSTMHKIYRGLVAMQNDPGLLNDINTMEPGKAKDRAIEARIKKNYSKYHEFYFRNLWPNQMTSYEQAQKFIMDAQMFHEIMTMRDRVREKGGQFTLTGDNDLLFNLHKDRYEILGGIENPHAKVDFRPDLVVKAYKKNLLTAFKRNEVMWSNLERMDTAYLARICAQIRMKVSDPAMKEAMEKDGLGVALSREYRCIETYLKAHRGVNLNFAVGNPSFREPVWSLEGLQKHIEGLGSYENKSYTDFEVSERNMTVAVHALYKFAEYFGYTGEPTETGLKEFLNEGSAKYHGIYWDGSGWYLQERGAEFDDFMGKTLTTAVVTKMIKRMREQPDNILEHRQDTIFVDAYDYSYEVKEKMAGALQKGLEEGETRGYGGEKRKAKLDSPDDYIVPPAVFNVDKPDYSLEPAALKEGYKKAIDDIKRQTLWTKLDYEIEDENYIKLKRKDGGATIWLTRHGKTWEVGSKGPDVCRGLTLNQAVALGNLVNWTRQWIKKSGKTPESTAFEIDGDRIDFKVKNNWMDTSFIEHWDEFYGKIGLSREKCVEVLNAFF